MKRLMLGVSSAMRIAVIGLFAVMMVAGAASARAQTTPEALIEQVGSQLLKIVKTDAAVQRGELPALLKVVDENVLPYVDFEKTTRLAAGRHWRQATEAQRQSLINEFRMTLVRTYSGAVSQVKQDTRIELRPARYAADATDVVVRTQILQSAGEPIQVDYRLEKQSQGWKIYDVNVMGIWLIENYRNQFSQEIGQHGFDGLIKSLATRNQSFAQAR